MDPAGVNSQIWVKVGPQPSTPHWEGLIKLAVCEWKRRSQGSWIAGYWGPRGPRGPDLPFFRRDNRGLEK